jgi:toxin ParE1/3/4
MKVRVTRDAFFDLDGIFAHIAKDSPAAAANVVDRIERVFERLSHFPESGQKTDLEGIRRLPITPYPYLVLYEVTATEVVIHHIRHGARRPWKGERRTR